MFGNHIDGAFAEFVGAPAKDAIAVPPELPLEEACVIADAASTPYHAVTHRGKVRPGERVVVFGCGGVGVNAVQFAAAAGASVVAVDSPSAEDVVRLSGPASVVVVVPDDSSSSPLHATRQNAVNTAAPAAARLVKVARRICPPSCTCFQCCSWPI
jgi:D-arabinose 1-dehydrogenase-like Zn-dependent alcohol dehydrogenase